MSDDAREYVLFDEYGNDEPVEVSQAIEGDWWNAITADGEWHVLEREPVWVKSWMWGIGHPLNPDGAVRMMAHESDARYFNDADAEKYPLYKKPVFNTGAQGSWREAVECSS